MPGLVPGIHVFLASLLKEDVDGRDEPGHDGVARFATKALLYHPDLAKIFEHAGMNQFQAGCGGNGVRGGGFAGLRQFLAQCAFDPMQRSRQPIGDVIGQTLARQNKAP
jgi:hypothetical protein